MRGWRKIGAAGVVLGILTWTIFTVIARGMLTDGIFIAWIGAVVTVFTVLVEGNVRSKKWFVEGKRAENGDNKTMGITG